LVNLVFDLSGTLSISHKEFEELIKKSGGEVVSSVTQRATHLISTPDEVKLKSSKIKKADKEEIPIVSEQFITDSIAKKELQLEEFYSLRNDDFKSSKSKDEDDDEYTVHGTEDFVESDEEEEMKSKKRKNKSPGGSVTPKAKKPKIEKEEKKPKVEKEEKKPKVKREEKKEKMSSEDFLKKAKSFSVKINTGGGRNADVLELEATPKEFARGSYGWICAGKVFKTTVAKHDINAQVTLNMIVRGSNKVQPSSGKVNSLVEKFESKIKEPMSSNDGEWVDDSIDEDEFNAEDLEEERDGNLSNLSIPLPDRSKSNRSNGSNSPSLKDPLGSEEPTENPGEEEEKWNCEIM